MMCITQISTAVFCKCPKHVLHGLFWSYCSVHLKFKISSQNKSCQDVQWYCLLTHIIINLFWNTFFNKFTYLSTSFILAIYALYQITLLAKYAKWSVFYWLQFIPLENVKVLCYKNRISFLYLSFFSLYVDQLLFWLFVISFCKSSCICKK